jgi:predicted phage terminase large subunit-like protein
MAFSGPPLPLEHFGRKYLPHYLTAPPSKFHRDFVGDLEGLHEQRGSRRAYIAPRGSAKSTWGTLAYPLRAGLRGDERYILLLSDTVDQARTFLASIKAELEGNEALLTDYPDAAGIGPEWQSQRIRLRNGVLIEALGTGSRIRGRRNRQDRPTLVVIDDPQGNSDIVSAIERQRAWDWLMREVVPAGTDATNFVCVGTALHRQAIAVRLQETAGWKGRVYRSIERWPDNAELWFEWERFLVNFGDPDRDAKALRFYEENREEMDAGAVVLWPEYRPLYSLMRRRAEIGPAAFDTEDQGNPQTAEGAEWPPEVFERPGLWFDDWPVGATILTIAVDPSKGADSKTGDYSAIVALARTTDGTLWVEADLKRRPINQIIGDGLSMMVRLRREVRRPVDRFAVETNQFQQMMMEDFREQAAKMGLIVPLKEVENRIHKVARIRQLTKYLMAGLGTQGAAPLMRFRSTPGTRLLVEQLRDFPTGAFDDGPDALQMSLDQAISVAYEQAGLPEP